MLEELKGVVESKCVPMKFKKLSLGVEDRNGGTRKPEDYYFLHSCVTI